MADKPASEKTEEPTQERLRKARQEGQIPQSKEVPNAIILGIFLVALALAIPSLYEYFVTTTANHISSLGGVTLEPPVAEKMMEKHLKDSIIASAPFLIGASAASVFSSLVSSGWSFSAKPVKVDFKRISPIKGAKNLVSLKALMNLLVSLAKLGMIGVIVYLYLRDKFDLILSLRWAAPNGLLIEVAELVFGVMFRVTVGLAAVAGIDLLYQRWNYKRELRMTLQEVKEERKQFEVSPEVKNRMRGIQIEMARKRMLQDVPQADVVIANPTHFAVALKYDGASMAAPTVLAKGPDELAKRIKDIAKDNDVPIVHRPELARAIYSATEVGSPVPEALFVAVAEVLAMVYRLNRKKRKNK